jgi:general secretion pathway protein A
MYNQYFGLNDSPFSIAPNPLFLYMSERHREALAHLLYGVQSQGGFILLTGEVGTGKTTVCRCLLEQLPEDVDVAFIINPKLSVDELLGSICDEFHIEYERDASRKLLVDAINDFLLESHKLSRRAVLIIDEAQNLSIDVLEQLRLLTNLETNERKLLQIILLGQPELQQLLAKQELRQLSQRVTARFHLQALSRTEVGEYIYHRLEVAGSKHELFPPAVINRIFRISEGIPRVINLICDRALLGAYAENKTQVSISIITKSAEEVLGKPEEPIKNRTPLNTILAVAFVSLVASVWFFERDDANKSSQDSNAANGNVQQANEFIDRNFLKDFQIDAPPSKPDISNLISLKSKVNSDNFESLSRSIGGSQQPDSSVTHVLNIWGNPPIEDSEPACSQIPTLGMDCLSITGSFADIKSFNRPVAMNLAAATETTNQPNWVALTLLSADTATLATSQSEVSVSESLLESWQGEFIVVWRMPPGYLLPTSEGSSGATVDWLGAQLSIYDGLPALAPAATFDKSFAERVKSFQKSVNLAPTGIVGPHTWVHLNSIEGIGVPFLAKQQELTPGSDD